MTSEFVQRALVSRSVWAPELKGRTAIVTGAGRLRSIGRPVALELARQGVNIVLTGTGRSPEHYPPDEKEVGWRDIESVAEEIRAVGAQVGALALVSDVAEPDAVADTITKAVDRFGSVDILVNNAGAARAGDRISMVDLPLEEWNRVIRVNLTGAFLMAQAAARQMIGQGRGGLILNISSIASRLAPAEVGVYSTSKAGLNALSHAMAMELAPHKIRVNSVLPGIIETARMDDLGRGEVWQDFIDTRIPLGVPGNGMEIAYMCAFLASDMGAWITGQDIAVDGGTTWR
jgi:3-oxoacyl-[acyl-carrier protein] reductase/meso-butanediol dehydrogenase/(S,S)-butanediol dehydrogenase/diacetyl reductase